MRNLIMMMDTAAYINEIRNQLFSMEPGNVETLALQVFRFQYEHNLLYRQYCEAIKTDIKKINNIEAIPFLPIRFFKSKQVTTTSFEPELVFESSGTTSSVNSKHFVKEKALYAESFLTAFELFYGKSSGCILGLLPTYLERQNSSLVYMVNELIAQSKHPESGFYLYDTEKLYYTLLKNEEEQQPTILIGVTYALLDFAEKYQLKLTSTVIMETGGMKGRREELTRKEVHRQLKERLGLNEIHSEYGMTELLSQAYSKGNGIFKCPPWMKVLLRSEDDPFDVLSATSIPGNFATGAVNIIDLANLYSCAFIATDDMGKLYPDESFEIHGRLEDSDVRGCGLMIV